MPVRSGTHGRPFRACAAAAATAALGLLCPTAASSAPRVHVALLPCPAPDQLEPYLLAVLAGEPACSDSEVELRVATVRPDTLLVRLQRGAALYERALRLERSDCEALPHTIAELARDWLREPWESLARAVADLPPAEPQQQEIPLPGAASATPPDRSVPTAAEPRPLATNPPATFEPPGLPSPGWRLAVQAGGFSTLRVAQGGFRLDAGAEWDAGERFGLALFAGYGAPVAKPLGPHRIFVAYWQAAILGRLALLSLPDRGSTFELLLGPSLQVHQAWSRPALPESPSPVADLAATLFARYRQPLSPRLAVFAVLGTTLRSREQRFRVRGWDPVFAVPRPRLDAAVGLAFGVP